MELSVLVSLLNDCYLKHYRTILVGGFDEPFYQAHDTGRDAQIQFSHDFIRSALHELAHWCVAGAERRKQDDYGYWYAADGRSQQQQNAFYQVEVKPQTIEWVFSMIIGEAFEPSVDNLDNVVEGVQAFSEALDEQLLHYLTAGFPKRVGEILMILAKHQEIADPHTFISQKLKQKKHLTC